MSNGGSKCLEAVPISDLEINALDIKYVDFVRHYLEHKLGCSFTYLVDGRYLIKFPTGTRETTIRFPRGETLTKRVYTFPDGGRTRTSLAFPFP